MSTRNAVQRTVDAFGQAAGFVKKSGSWYLHQSETISVVELQKSQYGLQYYVNVGLWLLPLGTETYPKERLCHIRTRLDDVVLGDDQHLSALLDLDQPIDDGRRAAELTELLTSQLLPALRACSTIEGLQSVEGQRLVCVAIVTGPAQRLLAVA